MDHFDHSHIPDLQGSDKEIDVQLISSANSLQSGAESWINCGGTVVRLRPNSKEPKGKWKNQATKDPADTTNWGNDNIGLICGNKSGIGAIDLDVNKETGEKLGQQIWKALETGYGQAANSGPIANTPSGGSHILFQYSKEFPNTSSIPFIDIKGEGGYIVVAPSKTDEGDYSLCGGNMLPPAPDWLGDACRAFKNAKVKQSFKLARGMRDGDGRNDHLFDSGIKMLRSGIPVECVQTAIRLLNKLFKEPLPENESERTIKSILESNAANTIEDFQYSLDSLNYEFVFCAADNRIYRTTKPMVPPMVKGAFTTMIGRAGKMWLSNPSSKVDDIGYSPGKDRIYTNENTGAVLFNTFHFPDHQSTNGDIKGFLELTENLWDEHSDYILDLLASIVKEPDKRIQVMPILMGGFGIGKNMWMDYVIAAIGQHNHARESLENIAGVGLSDWGDWAARTLICVVSEAESAGKVKYTLGPKIRDKITDEYLPINIKYGSKGTHRVFTSLWGFTNLESAIVVPPSDRRFFIHRTDFNITDPDQHQKYFAHRKSETQDPAVAGALFKHLKDRRIKDNPYGRAPMTAYKQTLMKIGTNETEEAIHHIIETWPSDCITSNALKEIVTRYIGREPESEEYKYAVKKITTINRGMKMRWKGSNPQRIYALRSGSMWINATAKAIREELVEKEEELYGDYGEYVLHTF